VLPGDGAGNLGAAITSALNVSAKVIVAADMNKDGKPDAVLAGNSNAGAVLSILINQGGGKFAAEKDYSLPSAPVSLAVGDFNGDGFTDVAVGVSSNGVYVLLGRASGTLGAPVKIDASSQPSSLAAADLNGDGRADLVIADQGFLSPGTSQQVNGALHVYFGNANGTFTAAAAPAITATNYSLVAIGDLNKDGKPDLIVGGNVAGTTFGQSTPNIYTLLGAGDGTFQAAQVTPLTGADGLGAQSIALGDFNGDGMLDMAVGNPNDYTEVWLGLGDGTFAQSLLALEQQPNALGATDLNGDGLPELLIGGGSGLAVFVNVPSWPPILP
jgi:hypothetical protein